MSDVQLGGRESDLTFPECGGWPYHDYDKLQSIISSWDLRVLFKLRCQVSFAVLGCLGFD